jgi:hypothetical protein
VAGFIDFDQLAKGARFERCFAILEIVYATFQKGVLGYELNDPERVAADSDDVHAAVGIIFDDFQYLGCATNPRDAVVHGQEHAERRFGVEAFADHATVTRLENVQGKLFAGKKNDVEREQRYSIRPHGCLGR